MKGGRNQEAAKRDLVFEIVSFARHSWKLIFLKEVRVFAADATLGLQLCATETEGGKYNQGLGVRRKGSQFGKWNSKVYAANDFQTFSEAMEKMDARKMSLFLKRIFILFCNFPLLMWSKLCRFLGNEKTVSCVWITTHHSRSKQVNECSRFQWSRLLLLDTNLLTSLNPNLRCVHWSVWQCPSDSPCKKTKTKKTPSSQHYS